MLAAGHEVTVECFEGFEFDDDTLTSPFVATCVEGNAGVSVGEINYQGVFDKPLPVCVPSIGGGGEEVEMTGSQKMLYRCLCSHTHANTHAHALARTHATLCLPPPPLPPYTSKSNAASAQSGVTTRMGMAGSRTWT